MTTGPARAPVQRPNRLFRFIAVSAVVASVVAGIGGFGLAAGPSSVWWTVAGASAVAFVQARSTLLRSRRARTEVQYHDDVLFPFLLVFLGPAGAVVAMAVGTLVANLVDRRAVVKAVYNVSQFTIAAGVGAGGFWLFESVMTDQLRPYGVLLGSLTFTVTGLLMFARLVHHLSGDPWRSAIEAEVGDHAQRYGAEVMLGSVAALAVEARPIIAPIAVLAILVVLETHRRWFRIARDRERLEDLLSATTSLHGAATVQQVQQALVDAIRLMTGAETEFSSSHDRPQSGFVVEVDTGAQEPETAVVTRLDPLDPTEVVIVGTLVRAAEVSMRVAALVELYADQSDQLAELIAEREAFLMATAHQLRTPLTAVLGFGHLIDAGSAADDVMEMARYIVQEASEMSNTLDNLLIASRAVTDSLLVASSQIDMGVEARRVCTEVGPNGSIAVLGEGWAVGDPVRVRQIVRNLIRNAFEHGGGQVTVVVGRQDEQTYIDVIDEGGGVSEDRIESLFLPLTRSNGHGGRPASTGLGLHAARQLARLMNGDVTYRREADRTIFRLDLPTPPTRSHLERVWSTPSGSA